VTDLVYEVPTEKQKGNLVLLGIAALLLACVAVVDHSDDVVGHLVVIGLFFAYVGLGLLFFTYRITLTDGGVVLGARVRQRFIAWPDLVAVDLGTGLHGQLSWQTRSRRRPVVTKASIAGAESMVVEVGRRAPHVRVSITPAGQRRPPLVRR
jgi:hypothetical protein